VIGPALPVRHFGSVDVFLEAFERSAPGSVLVIDNEGRDDEGCIGDLTVAEAKLAGVAAIIVWGRHRDDHALHEMGLPVWSMGTCPPGPRSARPRSGDPFDQALIGDVLRVTPADMVIADDDGVIFVAGDLWPDVEAAASAIVTAESHQAGLIEFGTSLREQLGFNDYVARHAEDPEYTLRRHLAERGGAIET
jgi:regulator of RNase E activity RraA